jgi:hypothetical protein
MKINERNIALTLWAIGIVLAVILMCIQHGALRDAMGAVDGIILLAGVIIYSFHDKKPRKKPVEKPAPKEVIEVEAVSLPSAKELEEMGMGNRPTELIE